MAPASGRELCGVAVEPFHLNRPFSPACARSLGAAFRRHRIEIAHSHEFSMAVYGAWASWLAGVPHLVTMHGSRYYAGRLRRRVALRSALAASQRTIAVSTGLADHMSRELWMPRARLAMVSTGVRRAQPAPTPLPQELRLSPDDRLLVAVATCIPVKATGISSMRCAGWPRGIHAAPGDLRTRRSRRILRRAQAREHDRVRVHPLACDRTRRRSWPRPTSS
jgi:hypothetical protein